MIKKCLLAACLVVAAYAGLLCLPEVRNHFSVQSHWQDNLIRFQDFVNKSPPPACVLIGTSLSRKFRPEAIGPEVYNLAATGGNVLTSLNLVANQRNLPHVLVVETTMIMQEGGDEGLVENVTRPVFYQLRPWIPMLQEKNQPVNLAANLLGEDVFRPSFGFLGLLRAPQKSGEERRPVELWREDQRRAVADRQFLYDEQRLERKCSALAEKVSYLRSRGVRIVLLDLPNDNLVMQTPRSRQVHDRLRRHLPPPCYEWIEPDPSRQYDTTDAIHLAETEIRSFEAQISERLAQPPRL